MAITDITVTDLALNTESANLNDTGLGQLGKEILVGSDGFNVDCRLYLGRRLVFIFTDQGGTADDITMEAGDRPPSQRADLGTTVVTMAASGTVAICLENGQFLGQGLGFTVGDDEGNIAGKSAGNNTWLLVLALPRDL